MKHKNLATRWKLPLLIYCYVGNIVASDCEIQISTILRYQINKDKSAVHEFYVLRLHFIRLQTGICEKSVFLLFRPLAASFVEGINYVASE